MRIKLSASADLQIWIRLERFGDKNLERSRLNCDIYVKDSGSILGKGVDYPCHMECL